MSTILRDHEVERLLRASRKPGTTIDQFLEICGTLTKHVASSAALRKIERNILSPSEYMRLAKLALEAKSENVVTGACFSLRKHREALQLSLAFTKEA